MNNKFVTDLKTTNPCKFYLMCKKIGAIYQIKSGDLCVRSLAGRSDKECAEALGVHFAAVSAEQSPVDLSQLPSYLPALPPPQVEEYQVFEKLKRLKTRRGRPR